MGCAPASQQGEKAQVITIESAIKQNGKIKASITMDTNECTLFEDSLLITTNDHK